MPSPSKTDNSNRDQFINLRVHQNQRDLIDRAAAILGKTRSEFMLDVVCREAKNVISDNTFFALDDAKYQQFVDALDSPPQANENLRKLLNTKSPWE